MTLVFRSSVTAFRRAGTLFNLSDQSRLAEIF